MTANACQKNHRVNTIHWDAFAALVALIGTPLMLSPNAIQAIKFIIAFTYKTLYPATAQCERIQWVDVPNGQLLQCKNDCHGYWEETQGSDCLNSTLGKFFQRAWVSASRRDKVVTKPKQLSLDTHYIRTDQKLVRAYLLLNRYGDAWFRENIIQFRDVDGVLTAHLLNRLTPIFPLLYSDKARNRAYSHRIPSTMHRTCSNPSRRATNSSRPVDQHPLAYPGAGRHLPWRLGRRYGFKLEPPQREQEVPQCPRYLASYRTHNGTHII